MTSRGIWFLLLGLLSCAAGLITGYDELLVLGLGPIAAVIVGTAWVLRRPALEVDREVAAERAMRGDAPIAALLAVTNPGRLPSPAAVAVEHVGNRALPLAVGRLAPGATATVTYEVPTDRRGRFDVGPVALTREDPLALWRAVREAGGTRQVWVHPRCHALGSLPAGRARSVEGDAGHDVQEGSATFHALREYVVGDDLRLVHWRSLARTGELMVRQNVDTGVPQLTLLVDTRAEALPDAAGFEAAMEVAASVAVAASHAGYAAKLVSSCGRAAGAGTGAPAPTAILDALAELGPSSRPWEEGLTSPVLGGRRDVLLTVSGLPSEADLAALGALGRRYRQVVLVLVGAGASTHPVPAAVANTVVRAVDGEEFALRWNHEVAA